MGSADPATSDPATSLRETSLPKSTRRSLVASGVSLSVAAVIVTWATVWGRQVQRNPDVKLGAAPLVGQWKFRPSIGYLMPIAVAVFVVTVAPRFFRTLQTRWVVLSTVGLTTAFTATLAGADGRVAMLEPVVHRTEYLAWLSKLPPTHELLTNHGRYEFLQNFSTHIKGHPPGYLLLLKALDTFGLAKPWIVASVSYLSAGLVAGSVLVVARRFGTSNITRKAAPLLILAPYAVWMGTSADAVFSALVAMAAAGIALASTSLQRYRRLSFGVVSGLALGAALYSSWGTVTSGTIIFGALWCGTLHSWQPSRPGSFGDRVRAVWSVTGVVLVSVLAGIAAVALPMTLLGYNWFAGMGLTRRFYWKGTAQFRPWKYFLVGNLGALLIAIGVVAVLGIGQAFGGLKRSGDRQPITWIIILLLCALTSVVAADLSQYSKGEVERIWLPVMPWLTLPAALLTRDRLWPCLQAVGAIGLQVMLISKW